MSSFIGHLSFEVTDIERAKQFFDALLGKLGFRRKFTMDDAVCYSNGRLDIWFAAAPASRLTRKPPSAEEDVIAEHTAILVSTQEEVKAVEKTMIGKGFKPLFAAQECPQFQPGYFSVSFVGPDNLVFEVYTKP